MYKLCGINVTPDEVSAIRDEVEKDSNVENWVPKFIGLYDNRLEENWKIWAKATKYQMPLTAPRGSVPKSKNVMSKSTPMTQTKK